MLQFFYTHRYRVLSQSLHSERSKYASPEEPRFVYDFITIVFNVGLTFYYSPADIDKNNTSQLDTELYRELKQEFDEYKSEQSKSYALLEKQLDQARVSVR